MNVIELKVAMTRQKFSVPSLAKEMGISRKTLYSRMRGDTVFNQHEIVQISKILNLTDNDVMRIFFDEKVS